MENTEYLIIENIIKLFKESRMAMTHAILSLLEIAFNDVINYKQPIFTLIDF